MENTYYKIELITGQRVDSQLIYTVDEKQIYRKSVRHNNIYSYVCYEETCDSRIYFDLDSEKCYKKVDCSLHNHGDQFSKYKELNLKNNMKNECLKAAANKATCKETVRGIYNRCVQQ